VAKFLIVTTFSKWIFREPFQRHESLPSDASWLFHAGRLPEDLCCAGCSIATAIRRLSEKHDGNGGAGLSDTTDPEAAAASHTHCHLWLSVGILGRIE
jgi:hypothetical protein